MLKDLSISGLRRLTTVFPRMTLRLLRKPLVLTYHLAGSERPHLAHYPFKTAQQFEADLIYLKRCFLPITYQEFRKGRYRPGQVLLTVDDGLREGLTVMRPLLLKHGIPCVFFVCRDLAEGWTTFIETKTSLAANEYPNADATVRSEINRILNVSAGEARQAILAIQEHGRADEVCHRLGIDVDAYQKNRPCYLDQNELKSLIADGFTLGAHTCTHPRLAQLSLEGQKSEITKSVEYVRQLSDASYIPFAYPWNGNDLDDSMLNSVKEEVPGLDLMFDTGGALPNRPHHIHRIAADAPGRHTMKTNLPELIGTSCANEIARRAAKFKRRLAAYTGL